MNKCTSVYTHVCSPQRSHRIIETIGRKWMTRPCSQQALRILEEGHFHFHLLTWDHKYLFPDSICQLGALFFLPLLLAVLGEELENLRTSFIRGLSALQHSWGLDFPERSWNQTECLTAFLGDLQNSSQAFWCSFRKCGHQPDTEPPWEQAASSEPLLQLDHWERE